MSNITVPLLAIMALIVVPLADTPGRVAGPTPTSWTPTLTPPDGCGRPLWITAVLPSPERGADGEWLVLTNPGPTPLELKGFSLRAGRRKRPVAPVVLEGGQSYRVGAPELGTMRLRNHDGAVSIVDPCDAITDTATWAQTVAGETLVRDGGWPAFIGDQASAPRQ